MILGSVGRFAARGKFLLAKHSPELCIVGGVIMFGATVVLACRATMKAEEVLDNYARAKADIEASKAASADPDIPDEVKQERNLYYTEEDAKRDRMVAVKDLCLGMAKKYWPVALCGAISVGLFLTSYKIINGRLVTAISAYTALDEGYKKYRERVVEAVGEEKEREIRTGIKKENGFVKEVTPEGDTVVNEKGVERGLLPPCDTQCVIFSENTSDAYRRGDPIYNETFLFQQERFFNDLLIARGYIFESEMRRALGLKVTPDSILRGYILDPANLPDESVRPISLNIRRLFRESGDNVLSTGRIVKELSGREWAIDFDDNVIWNLIDLWEDQRYCHGAYV